MNLKICLFVCIIFFFLYFRVRLLFCLLFIVFGCRHPHHDHRFRVIAARPTNYIQRRKEEEKKEKKIEIEYIPNT